MGATKWLTLLFTHPQEFRTLVQFALYHEKKRDITAQQEHPTSGWDRQTMRRCWEFLDMTSRSFAAVIKELDGDLARTICLFYLVLRGLDTIEDDMTIPDEQKQPLLRSFHEHIVTPGWKFTDSGPDEKDRQLLVEYDTIVPEINLLAPHYKEVILDICRKMETGMADYAHHAATSDSAIYLDTVAEYDLYCHYVAGLVGEGLSGIWSASGKEALWLAEQLELSNSMGLLLQKVNIIRDYREDTEEKRFFWPREIWGKYGFKELPELYQVIEAGGEDAKRAVWAQSGMVVDALRHATDALDYLQLLKNQSVFNFCAIPAAMAMATLDLCFMNKEMFLRNIKIRKAQAASLIMKSTNPRDVCYMFRDYARKIHHKSDPADPNFLRISVACGKIEQWCEHHYPSFINLGATGQQMFNPADARTRIVQADEKRDKEMERDARLRELREKRGAQPSAVATADANGQGTTNELLVYVGGAIVLVLAVGLAVIYTVLYFSD